MFSFLVSTQPALRHSDIEQTYCLSSISFFDATTSNRIGFRGQHAASFLQQQGLEIPPQPNNAVEMRNGLWVLRLSLTEFWVLDVEHQHTEAILELEKAALNASQVTRLYCQHSSAMFVLTGDACPQMFAKVCAVDFQPDVFTPGHIAQTSVARVSSVVVNTSQSAFKQTRFFILSDISSADYLWHALEDAALEFQQTIDKERFSDN
ncbi:hypothetical protein [Enterovibrio calviensis]|uniref:hypothetical protein n=1 Tax=Enterovibrio calviensis TaxID=91359 RepID=UPI0037370BCE